MKKQNIIYALLAFVLGAMAVSCNNKSTSDEETVQYYGVSTSSTMVSRFVLGSNSKVLNNLDSVFFTIDQDRRLIYNADSLPVGTDVRKLTVSLTFPYSVRSAQFRVTNGKLMKDTTITYSSATKDTIDFTGNVLLNIVSRDGLNQATYTVKVNVHQVEPDKLTFAQDQRRDLPNVNGTPDQVKAVELGEEYLCLIEDGGKYVLSSTTRLGTGTWSKKELNVPFTAIVGTLTATTDALYMLDISGELFKSTDHGDTWTDCSVVWNTIVGGYDKKVLGVLTDGGVCKHDEYPRGEGFTPKAIPEGFPVSGTSPMVIGENNWASSPQAMIVGGMLQDGSLTNATWAFDGERWGRIDMTSSAVLPKVIDALVIPYYTYDVDLVHHRVAAKQVTWLLMGGRLADGSLNRTTYVSRDQGMTWLKGGDALQQPDYMPSFYAAQAFVQTEKLPAAALAPSTETQPITSWECPYIYLVGGYTTGDVVLNSIWKGVLNRLTYKPIF